MNIKVEIASDYSKWHLRKEINSDLFADIVEDILKRYNNFNVVKEVEVSILLTDDSKMKSLNKEFRGVEKSTNVLSFPDLDVNWKLLLEFKPDDNYIYLGDIAFGYQIVFDEAESKKISFEDHFKHLLIHAILHLLGYDHIEDDEAQIMEALEIDILKNYKIKSPY